MKTTLITAMVLALAAATVASAPASAAPASRVETRSLYTCAANGLSRVSLGGVPHVCCDGLLGCPQLLSNTGLIKPKRDSRT